MILTDTHVIVWLANGDKRLPPKARDTLVGQRSFAVSAITAWEYVELQRRDRLPGSTSFEQMQVGLNFTIEPLPPDFWALATSLPQIHQDPIDRLLVAHALALDATLATADSKIRRYPVKTLW